MKIIIEEKTKNAMKRLMIKNFPFSETTLKQNYKQLVFKYHPDRNKDDKEAEAKAKEIINAYKLLENLAITEPTEETANIIKKQYKKDKLDMFIFWEPCQRCKTTGKIIIREWPNITIKDRLNFDFYSKKIHPKYRSEICPVCHGVGEVKVKLFNPVIPKGGVMI